MPLDFETNTIGDFIKMVISKSTFQEGVGYSWTPIFFDFETAYEPGYWNSKTLTYPINHLFQLVNLVTEPCFTILDIVVPEPVYCGNLII